MILVGKGKLSLAQSVAATAADSTNVMKIGSYSSTTGKCTVSGLEGAKVVIQNAAAAAAVGTLTIDIVLAREATLDNVTVLDRTYIAAGTDYRLATAGAPIQEYAIPAWVGWLAKKIGEANTSDMYLGLIITTTTFTLLINAAVASTVGEDGAIKTQETESPVGVPAVCSAGSGE